MPELTPPPTGQGAPANPDGDSAERRWAQIFQVLSGMAVMFMVAGLLALLFAARDFAQVRAAAGWLPVAGVITVSEPTQTPQPGRDARFVPWARIAYTYEAGGRDYTSERIGLQPLPVDPQGGTARRLLNDYPLGAAVTVFTNPADPAEAVLERGQHDKPLGAGMSLIVAGLGVAAVAWIIRRRHRPRVRQ